MLINRARSSFLRAIYGFPFSHLNINPILTVATELLPTAIHATTYSYLQHTTRRLLDATSRRLRLRLRRLRLRLRLRLRHPLR